MQSVTQRSQQERVLARIEALLGSPGQADVVSFQLRSAACGAVDLVSKNLKDVFLPYGVRRLHCARYVVLRVSHGTSSGCEHCKQRDETAAASSFSAHFSALRHRASYQRVFYPRCVTFTLWRMRPTTEPRLPGNRGESCKVWQQREDGTARELWCEPNAKDAAQDVFKEYAKRELTLQQCDTSERCNHVVAFHRMPVPPVAIAVHPTTDEIVCGSESGCLLVSSAGKVEIPFRQTGPS